MELAFNRAVIYTRKMQEMTEFYTRLFGYEAIIRRDDRIVELRPKAAGLTLLLHPAGKGQKQGQAAVKLVFDVADVESCRTELLERGLDMGPVHTADGYQFANAKDPSGNGLSISSRAFADHRE